MAKPKGNPGIQNRHIYTRASYLYQAASYLASCAHQTKKGVEPEKAQNEDHAPSSSIRGTPSGVAHDSEFVHRAKERKAIINLSRQVISDMRSVSLKAQIRQSPSIKQTICRYCDSVQIEGKTCSSTVENLSKGGRKPWADVLVTRCDTCGNVKRYPISTQRQKRRPFRTPGTPKMEKESTSTPPALPSTQGLPT